MCGTHWPHCGLVPWLRNTPATELAAQLRTLRSEIALQMQIYMRSCVTRPLRANDTHSQRSNFIAYSAGAVNANANRLQHEGGAAVGSRLWQAAQAANFTVMMPPTIRAMPARRTASADSPNSTMPSSAVPSVPMPVHTA